MTNTPIVKELDSFIIESGRRKVVLARVANGIKPFAIFVLILRKPPKDGAKNQLLLSTSEYYTEESARHDFEVRRPKMRDAADEDMPMQKGKRLIQEVMQEKLGG
jgi:hypothetical protein